MRQKKREVRTVVYECSEYAKMRVVRGPLQDLHIVELGVVERVLGNYSRPWNREKKKMDCQFTNSVLVNAKMMSATLACLTILNIENDMCGLGAMQNGT